MPSRHNHTEISMVKVTRMKSTRFKTIRVSSGVTQAEISKALGIDQARISRLENGYLPDSPATGILKARVAEFLGVSVEILFPADVDVDAGDE